MAVVQGGTFGTPFGEDPDFQIRQRLRPGENLLWSGRPDPAVRFSPADRFLVPFSIMWGGFALFWEASVIASGGAPFFVLWGIPFVIMGLYFIFGRFWFKRRQKLRTAYGITNERAIVAVGNSQVMETPIKNQPLSLTRSSDGRHGSVECGGEGPHPHASTTSPVRRPRLRWHAGTACPVGA